MTTPPSSFQPQAIPLLAATPNQANPQTPSIIKWVNANGAMVAQIFDWLPTGPNGEFNQLQLESRAPNRPTDTTQAGSKDSGFAIADSHNHALQGPSQILAWAGAPLDSPVPSSPQVTVIDSDRQSSFPQLVTIGKIGILGGYIDGRSNPPGVLFGSGFTATKTGTGAYTITFTNAFSSFPAVATTSGILGNHTVRTPNIGSGSIGFQVIDFAGAAADEFVGFIVVGPL